MANDNEFDAAIDKLAAAFKAGASLINLAKPTPPAGASKMTPDEDNPLTERNQELGRNLYGAWQANGGTKGLSWKGLSGPEQAVWTMVAWNARMCIRGGL